MITAYKVVKGYQTSTMIQNIKMWKSKTVIPSCNQKEYNYTVLIVIYTINLNVLLLDTKGYLGFVLS